MRGDPVGEDPRSGRRRCPGEIDEILHCDGKPVQRPPVDAACQLTVRLARTLQGSFSAHELEGVEGTIEFIDPPECCVNELRTGRFTTPECLGELKNLWQRRRYS